MSFNNPLVNCSVEIVYFNRNSEKEEALIGQNRWCATACRNSAEIAAREVFLNNDVLILRLLSQFQESTTCVETHISPTGFTFSNEH